MSFDGLKVDYRSGSGAAVLYPAAEEALLTRPRFAIAALLAMAMIVLVLGWGLFWFLTDDAFIAFRYVSNSMLGYGYVWNAPPFRPVQGYTSLLWVILLDAVWRALGVPPPASANVLSLLFSAGTLGLAAAMTLRLASGPRLHRHGPLLLGLVLLGIVTNRTFLAWTSSGLETALFDFLLVSWVYLCLFVPPAGPAWIGSVSLAALLLSMARPDGLIFVAATVVLAGLDAARRAREGARPAGALLAASPLLGVPAQLVWQRAMYGSWTPNTYAAKVVAPWPASGVRYALSFVMEYFLWIWIAVAVAALARWLPAVMRSARSGVPGGGWLSRHAARACVIGAVGLHLLFYTVVAGGDHFEYRVFNHLITLLPLSLLWMMDRLAIPSVRATTILALSVALSWPIPWTHFALTRNFTTREETYKLFRPVAPSFPPVAWWYAAGFDRLQHWLIRHQVCMRHQEHKVFEEYQAARLPRRDEERALPEDRYPVFASPAVGMPGWVFPHMAILDLKGLNDRVIARAPVRPTRRRQMAHEREAPPGYVDCFQANVGVLDGQAYVVKRPTPFTADDIRACESRFWK